MVDLSAIFVRSSSAATANAGSMWPAVPPPARTIRIVTSSRPDLDLLTTKFHVEQTPTVIQSMPTLESMLNLQLKPTGAAHP